MSTGKRRVFDREFKLSAIERLISGENAASLCDELKISRSRLSLWCSHYRRHGLSGLRKAGRPYKTDAKLDRVVKATDFEKVRERIGELERKIGQQQIELDFFRLALRRVAEARRPNDGPGVKASTL